MSNRAVGLRVLVLGDIEARRARIAERHVERVRDVVIEVVRAVHDREVPLPLRGQSPAQARRQRQVHVVRVEHRDVAVGEDRRHVGERIRVAEEVRALAVAVRVAAEGIDLERIAERERRVVHEGDVLHRAVARLVRLRAGEREVCRRLLLEERDLVGAGTQRLVAVAVLGRQVQEAVADAEAAIERREQRVAVVDAASGRLEVGAVLAPTRRRLAALVGVLQHDVDDAGDGVRTVLRAGAVAKHLDPLDRADRDAVEVDRARTLAELRLRRERRGRVPALAVDQHQDLVGAQVSQLCRAYEVREIRIRLARQVERRDQRLDRRAHLAGNRGGPADRLGSYQVDRGEALVEAAARGTRADDDDLLELRLAVLRQHRARGKQHHARRTRTQGRPDGRTQDLHHDTDPQMKRFAH